MKSFLESQQWDGLIALSVVIYVHTFRHTSTYTCT